MSNKINASGSIISWLEKVVELESKYGFFKIIKALFLIVLSVCVAFFMLNPGWFYQKIEDYINDQHIKAMEKRLNADLVVRAELDNLLLRTDAEYAVVFESHNGSNNLSGLPFLFVDMVYEQHADDSYPIIEEWQNVPTSRYPFLVKVWKEGYWYGPIEDLKEIDTGFYHKLKADNVNYLALVKLHGVRNPIGFIGIGYDDEDVDQERLTVLGREIRNSAMVANMWLDNERVDK